MWQSVSATTAFIPEAGHLLACLTKSLLTFLVPHSRSCHCCCLVFEGAKGRTVVYIVSQGIIGGYFNIVSSLFSAWAKQEKKIVALTPHLQINLLQHSQGS